MNPDRAFFSVSGCASHIYPNAGNRHSHFSTLKNAACEDHCYRHKAAAYQTRLGTAEIFIVITKDDNATCLLSLH